MQRAGGTLIAKKKIKSASVIITSASSGPKYRLYWATPDSISVAINALSIFLWHGTVGSDERCEVSRLDVFKKRKQKDKRARMLVAWWWWIGSCQKWHMKMFHTLGMARPVEPGMAWHGIGLFGEGGTSTAQTLLAKNTGGFHGLGMLYKTLEWSSRCAPRPSFAKGQMPNWSVKTNNAPWKSSRIEPG